MYLRRHVKCLLLSFYFNKLNNKFSWQSIVNNLEHNTSRKFAHRQKTQADGQTDRNDEANIRFSQLFCGSTKNDGKNSIHFN
jgi:hypothetical protein